MDKERLMSNFTFNVTSQMTPSVTLIASYVTDKNEIVADSIKVNVELPLAHMVSSIDDSAHCFFVSRQIGSNAYIVLTNVIFVWYLDGGLLSVFPFSPRQQSNKQQLG